MSCCGSIFPRCKFYSLLFLGIVMYDNKIDINKENKIENKYKAEPQYVPRNCLLFVPCVKHKLRCLHKGLFSNRCQRCGFFS